MISPSDSINYKKIKEVFNAALDLAPEERSAFLNATCADENARGEVESLLNARAEAGEFLEDVSAVSVVRDSIGKNDQFIGQTVGKYLIEREIGRGGMGAVYLATRTADDFKKRVAVKFIKRGADSDESLRRFRQERRILASLEHPFIARLIDGGAAVDGTPYLIMEYVEGLPIDEFCEQNNLSTGEKLTLFQKICAAVAHAHRNLTIHRDLKASNILVTKEGEPKLLDFGIAKLFSGETETAETETQTNFRALTPEYASPEQLRGETLTTATDVYSLGVVLYEILTGARPFATKGKNFAEVLRIVSEINPTRPSALSSKFKVQSSKSSTQLTEVRNPKSKIQNPKSIDSDLDNIVLKALAKEPERRYGSVEQFSEDIERYLKGLPVAARKDTFGYRSKKFIKRHSVGVAALTAIFLLLVVGICAVLRQSQIAERERQRAERRAENLRKLSSSFVVELHDAILNLPGSLPARQLLLTRAVEQLDTLAAESDGSPQLQSELAQGYYNLSVMPNINLVEAEKITDKAVTICQKLVADNPQNGSFRQQLAKGFLYQANLQKVRGNTSTTLSLLQQSMEILEKLAADKPDAFENRSLLQEVEGETAMTLMTAGKAREALEISRKARILGEDLVNSGKTTDDYDRLLTVAHFDECKSLTYLGEYQKSLELLRADFQIASKLAETHPNDTRYRYLIWAYHRNLATVSEFLNDKKAARENLQSALDLMEGLLKMSADDVGYQRNNAYTNLSFGQFLVRQNQAGQALPYLRRALEVSEKIYIKDSQRGETVEDLARIDEAFGSCFILLGKNSEASKALRESLDFFQKALEKGAENVSLRRDYAETLSKLGETLQKSPNPNERSEAKDYFTRSLQIWQTLQNQGILSYQDAEQPKLAAQKLLQFDSAAIK